MVSQSCINFFAIQDRAPGEPFVAKSEKEAEMERLMKSMEVIVRDCIYVSLYILYLLS